MRGAAKRRPSSIVPREGWPNDRRLPSCRQLDGQAARVFHRAARRLAKCGVFSIAPCAGRPNAVRFPSTHRQQAFFGQSSCTFRHFSGQSRAGFHQLCGDVTFYQFRALRKNPSSRTRAKIDGNHDLIGQKRPFFSLRMENTGQLTTTRIRDEADESTVPCLLACLPGCSDTRLPAHSLAYLPI